jgi:hypothetical protein
MLFAGKSLAVEVISAAQRSVNLATDDHRASDGGRPTELPLRDKTQKADSSHVLRGTQAHTIDATRPTGLSTPAR